jgi:uncharacterized lipoprotein YbaY
MRKHMTLTIGAATLLTLGACGSREAERAAPEAVSTEADATSSVSAANPETSGTIGFADTSAQKVDRPGQEAANTPPPGA